MNSLILRTFANKIIVSFTKQNNKYSSLLFRAKMVHSKENPFNPCFEKKFCFKDIVNREKRFYEFNEDDLIKAATETSHFNLSDMCT